MTDQSEVRDVIAAYGRALWPIRDLRDSEYLNGTKAAHNVADTIAELTAVDTAVDTAERALVLALIRAGLPAATVARRCRIAPATVRRWLAGETA